MKNEKGNPVISKTQTVKKHQESGVFGVEEMLNTLVPTPLHSFTAKKIEDYGELCDQDCQDCD